MAKRDISQRYRDDWSPHPHVAFKRYASITSDQNLDGADEPGSGEPAKAFMIISGSGDFVYQTPEQTTDQTFSNAEDLIGVYMPVELTKIDEDTDDSLVVVAFW